MEERKGKEKKKKEKKERKGEKEKKGEKINTKEEMKENEEKQKRGGKSVSGGERKKKEKGFDSRCFDCRKSLVRELKLVYSTRAVSRCQKQKR